MVTTLLDAGETVRHSLNDAEILGIEIVIQCSV
ncbi:hypothetical protein H4I95_08629 [Botrytis cinerea]